MTNIPYSAILINTSQYTTAQKHNFVHIAFSCFVNTLLLTCKYLFCYTSIIKVGTTLSINQNKTMDKNEGENIAKTIGVLMNGTGLLMAFIAILTLNIPLFAIGVLIAYIGTGLMGQL